jgi:hypothetical protein
LFDRELVNCYKTNTINAGNEAAQYNIKGIQAWRQFDHVVELTEIMRQIGDDILIDLLGRLRKGVCTEADKELLDAYVLSDPRCSQDTKNLTGINMWLEGKGCPLITYCNEARDLHNFEMSKAFAQATGQEVALYHSIDTRGKGKSRRELRGVAAEAAWSVPVKEAEDLPGKVPYVSGMPVFCTDNIATELGLSKGSMGTLVAVKYVIRSDRRYAISAEVDFPGFRGGEDPLHPHRVLLKTTTGTVHYSIPGSCTRYAATRNQLPLIPAFAFTSHNSQGRSLEAACVDLASCRSLQSAYVMLSRLRSRKGLCILRPFRLRTIQNHISQELRQELERTAALELKTLALCKTRLDWYYLLYPSDVFDTAD